MATAAIAAYGTELRMGNGIPLAQLGVASTTATTPIILTTVAHGIPIGEVSWADVFGVTGNPGANGSWIVQAQTATTLVLRGSVGTGVSSGTGGLIFRNTFLTVAELVNITPIGIAFNMVDCSAHDGSGWGSSLPTFKRGVDMRVEINLVPTHVTHGITDGMIGLALAAVRRDWLIVLPDPGKSAMAFQAWVSDHGTVTPFDGVLRSTPVLSIDGRMDFSYA